MARWHIYDQAGDLAAVYRFQVLTDAIYVPVVNERRAGLNDGPCLADELGEVPFRLLPADLSEKRRRVNLG